MWLFVLLVTFVPVQLQKVLPDPDTIEGYKQTPDGLKFRCGFVGSICDMKFSNSWPIYADLKQNGEIDKYIMIVPVKNNWSIQLSRAVTSYTTDNNICFYLRYQIVSEFTGVALHVTTDETEPHSVYNIPPSPVWSETWLQLHGRQLYVELRGQTSKPRNTVMKIRHISLTPEKCSRPARPVSCNGSMWLNTAGWSWTNCFHVNRSTTRSNQPTTSSQLTRGVPPVTELPRTSTTEINKQTPFPTRAGSTAQKPKTVDTTLSATSIHSDLTTTTEEPHRQASEPNAGEKRKVFFIGAICGGLVGVIAAVAVIIYLYVSYNRRRRVATRGGAGPVGSRTNSGPDRMPDLLAPTVRATRTSDKSGVEDFVNVQTTSKPVEHFYPVSTV